MTDPLNIIFDGYGIWLSSVVYIFQKSSILSVKDHIWMHLTLKEYASSLFRYTFTQTCAYMRWCMREKTWCWWVTLYMQTFTAVKNTQHIMILITNVNVEFGCIHRYRLFESIESKYVCKFDIYCLWNPFRKKALFQFTFRICNLRFLPIIFHYTIPYTGMIYDIMYIYCIIRNVIVKQPCTVVLVLILTYRI